jgi:hypothetical protein
MPHQGANTSAGTFGLVGRLIATILDLELGRAAVRLEVDCIPLPPSLECDGNCQDNPRHQPSVHAADPNGVMDPGRRVATKLGPWTESLKTVKRSGASSPNYKMALIGRDGSILFWTLIASTGGEALELLLLSPACKR